MKFNLTTRVDGVQVDLQERLGFTDHTGFRSLVGEVCETKPSRVVVDLAGVTAIDSAGLGLLVILNDRVKLHGGTVTLTRPSEVVARLLGVVEFEKIFAIEAAA